MEAAYTENSLLRRSLHRELETLQETYAYKGVPASQYLSLIHILNARTYAQRSH